MSPCYAQQALQHHEPDPNTMKPIVRGSQRLERFLRLGSIPRWRVAVGLGMVGLLPRLLAVATIGRTVTIPSDTASYDRFARLMLSGWSWFTTPLFYREPGYPAFMALAYALPGADLVGVQILQAFLGAGTVVVVHLTSRRLLGESAAIVAALFVAFNLNFVGLTISPLRETLVIFGVATFVMTFFNAVSAVDRIRWLWCALSFVLLAHTDVRFLPLVVVVPFMALAYGRNARLAVRQTLWFGIFFVLLMIPYQTRGYLVLGKPVIITENFLGKFSERAISQVFDGGTEITEKAEAHRLAWLRDWESAKRAELDTVTEEERKYFQAGGRPRTDRLGAHWFLFLEYWRFARFKPEYRPYPDGRFADPWSLRHNLSSSVSLLPFLMLLPFVFLRPSDAAKRVAWALLVFLFAHAAMHVVVHARARYRIPMEIITSVLIAIALVNLWEFLKQRLITKERSYE